MAISLDSKQVVSFEELLNVSGGPTRSPCEVTCRKRDIHQGGVLGDGELSRSGYKKRTISDRIVDYGSH